MLVTRRTRPRNSGGKPNSLVVKKKKAESELGVACKRKRKAAGSQIVFWVPLGAGGFGCSWLVSRRVVLSVFFWVTACRSCFSWSLTVSKSVVLSVFSSAINQAVADTMSGKDAVIKKIVWVLKCCSREPLR